MSGIDYRTAEGQNFYSEDHESFRTAVRDFIERDVATHYAQWKEDGRIGREFWLQAARNGLLGLAVDEDFGGLGLKDYRYRLIFDEELARHHLWEVSLSLHLVDDLMLPVLLRGASIKQQETWLPKVVSGEMVGSTAMTEPGAGSDLRAISTFARRHDDGWSINGQKTLIGMGQTASWVLVLAKTGKGRGDDSMSFFLVPKGPNVTAGQSFKKMGFTASDTAELFFDEVRVSPENLVGEVGTGFRLARDSLAQLRLAIASMACVMAEQSIRDAIVYARQRPLFGQKLENFQNTHFELSHMESRAQAVRALLEKTVLAFNRGVCTGSDIAALKLFATDSACNIADRCLQLFGGAGYIVDSDIANTFLCARSLPILGGSNEIMKTIIAQDLGLQSIRCR